MKKKKTKRIDPFLKFLSLSLVFFLLVNLLMILEEISPAEVLKQGVGLSFSPPQVEGKELETSIMLNPEEERMIGADLTIYFNPQRLTFLRFEPGETLDEPVILTTEVDQEKGRLRVALFTTEPDQEAGSLVNLSFLINNQDSGLVKIEVDDKETKLVAVGKKENVLGETQDFVYKLLGH